MLILKHNTHLSVQELFEVEHIMLKIADRKKPLFSDLLEWSVLEKSRPVTYGVLLGYASLLGVYQTLDISPSEFFDFLLDVDRGYLPNQYHAFPHAADVTLVIYHMLVEFEVGRMLTSIDLVSLFIAGLCHDLGHPGKNNNFQVNRKTDLAIRYQNLSVLESYSCTLTIQLLEKHRLLRNVGWPAVGGVRASIVKMILATDMVFHYELQENLANLLEIVMERQHHHHRYDPTGLANNSQCGCPYGCHHNQDHPVSPSSSAVNDIFDGEKSPLHLFFDPDTLYSLPLSNVAPNDSCTTATTPLVPLSVFSPGERQMLCQIVLHAADISNPLRVWKICNQWSDRVCQEFFCQGEQEKQLGLPVSPNMDRDQTSQTTIGLQFGDFIVSPFFEIFAALFPKAAILVKQLGVNRIEWLQLEEERASLAAAAAVAVGVTVATTATRTEDVVVFPTDKLSPAPHYHDNSLHANQPMVDIVPTRGKRVSVAAGMIVIPEERLQRPPLGIGTRSASDTGGDVLFLLRNWRRAQDDRHSMDRRRSEEPSLLCHLARRLESPPSPSSSQRRRMSSIRQAHVLAEQKQQNQHQQHHPIVSPQ